MKEGFLKSLKYFVENSEDATLKSILIRINVSETKRDWGKEGSVSMNERRGQCAGNGDRNG